MNGLGRRQFMRAIGSATAVGLGALSRTSPLRAQARSSDASEPLPKKVFAHYMIMGVGYAPYPPNFPARVSAYKKEVLHAQAKGIDGFVINTGVWDAQHKAACDAMYEAAKLLDTGFKLFFSIDFNLTTYFDTRGRQAMPAAREIVTRYKDHPCQFFHNGRQVVSTFYGSQYPQEYWEEEFILPLAQQDVRVLFIPNFRRYQKWSEEAMSSYIEGIYKDYPFIDGLFHFGGALVPGSMLRANRHHAAVARKLGKIYLAAVSPNYSVHHPGNNRVFEYRGGEGMCVIWEGIIEDDPPWVEIVTWNDFGEQHYIGPSECDIDGTASFPHLAYLELCEYYIEWFKTGKRPEIHEDKVFYFYRSHSKDAIARSDPLPKHAGWEEVIDAIFVTAMLSAPARLLVETGNETESFDLPAGMSHLKRPFRAGSQAISLERGGKTILKSTGALIISDTMSEYNFNYYSNFAIGEAWRPAAPAKPKSWVLLQNHPNPFTGETRIRFWAPMRTNVRLEVLDNKGAAIATLLDRHCEPGANTVVFDGKALPSGLYRYRLAAGSHSETRRMVVLKKSLPTRPGASRS